MAITTNATAKLVRKNLMDAVLASNSQKRKNVWKDMIGGKEISTTQLFEEMALVSPLALPSVTPEYGPVAQSDVAQIATKTYQPEKRTLQVRMSDEFFINDQYGYAKGIGTKLMHVFYLAKEIACATFMNNCITSANLATPQGQPYASTAHPLESGTDSNRFSTAQTLGITAVEDAVEAMMLFKTHKGYVQPSTGSYNLEVHPSNAMLAKRLFKSELQPGTADNDKNVARDSIANVIVNNWFTNAGYWALHATDEMENRRFLLNRYGVKVTELEYDSDNDSWKVTAKESYIPSILDWRDSYFSPAA